ncbi:MAG: hypothetical protein ACIWVG_29465 [Gloeotrichia echinulata HAB0833]
MKKKTLESLGLNWTRYIFLGVGTTLVTYLLLTTGISVNPAFAADGLVSETHSTDLSLNQTAQEYSDSAAVVVEQDTAASPKSETIVLEKQPQLIAQIDSSAVVGDTFADVNKLRQQLLIEPIIQPGESTPTISSSSAGTPTAYGASWRQAFVGGVLYVPLDKGKTDGSFSFGFGAGDSVKSVGLETSFNIISVGGQKPGLGDFADSGTVGLKLHKYFEDGTAVALGWSNPIKWGQANKAKESIYGVVTKSFDLQPDSANNKLPLTVSVGLGSGDYRSLGAIRKRQNSVNLFGSLGLRVIPEASLVGSWTGNSLNLGVFFAPFKKTPIVINTIFTDVTSNFNNGVGFSLSAGYAFQF